MNWIVLKSLNEIYRNGSCPRKESLVKDPTVGHMITVTGELSDEGDEIVASDGFPEHYETSYLAEFNVFHSFLIENNLKKPQTRFTDSDIRILMMLKSKMDSGELTELREQIIEYNETVRGVSQMYFRNEKYLDDKTSLVDALKQILNVPGFANNKAQQYMYRLECHDPRKIVLCENLDFLLRAPQARKHHIELWYAGGKNISKLQYSLNRDLPMYYSCDWDHDGMLIYALVKKIFPSIKLLYPTGKPRSIKETDHDSHWLSSGEEHKISGTDKILFTQRELDLLRELIASDSWVIEESNKLINMLSDVDSTS